MSSGPLQGVKVLELGTLIAGPFCARMLAEFGAEVIKIEAPEGGDQIRQWRKMHEGTSLWWYVPYRDRPGFGVVAEAIGGMRYITGYPDRPPVRLGISIGDSIAALHGVI